MNAMGFLQKNVKKSDNELPELYTKREQDAIGKHIAAHFGVCQNVLHELVSPDVHVDIYVVNPTPERNYYTLVTVGMGAHRMNVPKDLEPMKLDRAELLVTLPPDWEISNKDEEWYWPLRWLKILARLPSEEDTWLGYGHTVPHDVPFAANTKFCCIMLTMPYFFGAEAGTCKLPNGDAINFYQMLPLYESEMNYKLNSNAEELENMFPDDFDMVVDITRKNVVSQKNVACARQLYDGSFGDDAEEEDDSKLKAALLGGEEMSKDDLERLARSLSIKAVYLADLGGEEFEEADNMLSLLYLCQERLPDSDVVKTALLEAALAVIGAAGDKERFDTAEKRIAPLLDLQMRRSGDELLLRVSANALIAMVNSYLLCDPAKEKEARRHYAALERLAEQHEDNPAMAGMLAWGKRAFIIEYAAGGNIPASMAALEELRGYLGKNIDNTLVAKQYAGACSNIFYQCLRQPDLYRQAVELLDEIERQAKRYNASHRALGDTENGCDFPGYNPGDFYNYVFGAIGEMASFSAEKMAEKPLLDCLDRMLSVKEVCPESFNERKTLLAQIYQNLAYIYGIGNTGKTETYIKELRKLWEEAPETSELAGTLADALYNYVTEYAENGTVKHNAKIRSLINELEQIAEAIDDIWTRTRYASALFNLYVNSPDDDPDYQAEEKLYRYSLENTVGPEVARQLAVEEVRLIATAGGQRGRQHYERVKTLCGAEQYRLYGDMAEQSAAADYNMLTVAADMKNIGLAKSMMDSLIGLAKANPDNRGVVLRVVKAAKNIMYDYGEMRDIERAETVLDAVLPIAAPFAEEPEIANRVVDAAYNLCVDMKNSGNMKRTPAVYGKVKGLKTDGESAGRMEKLKREYSGQ